MTRDLRQYLNTRFPKGGVDHELQNTIRDNVYLRTVPVTTRNPRPGELNGLDYTFLSHPEFEALRRSGNLLESGNFQGLCHNLKHFGNFSCLHKMLFLREYNIQVGVNTRFQYSYIDNGSSNKFYFLIVSELKLDFLTC